jgi:hypothetical protein
MRQEVETVQTLHHPEASLLDAPLGRPPFPVQQFLLRQPQQVTGIIHAFGGALLRHFVVLAQEGWQPQRLQVMVQQNLGSLHQQTPSCAGVSSAR